LSIISAQTGGHSSDTPAAPTLLSPLNGENENDNTPTFTWIKGENADNHRILVDNDNDLLSPIDNELLEATAENWTKLEGYADGTYYWKVIAIKGENENSSSVWTFNVDTLPPAKPTLISPEDNKLDNGLSQAFKWAQPPENSLPLTYHIQIDNEASFTSPYVYENSAVTDNTYPYLFSTDGTYYWRIRARDNAGNWGTWADNFKLTLDTTPPDPPPLVWPAYDENIKDNAPALNWSDVTDPSTPVTYGVQVDNDSDFSSPAVNVTGLATSTYTTSELAEGVWYWRADARDNAGNAGAWSASRFRVDITKPLAPTLVSPSNDENISYNTPNLDWNPISENSLPALYKVYVDNDSNFSSIDRESPWVWDDNWVVTPGLLEGIWYWKVGAKDNAGNVGDNSASRSFRVDVTPPGKPTLASPEHNYTTSDNTPTFRWTAVTDNSLPVTYDIQIDNEASFTSPYVYSKTKILENQHTCENELAGGTYYWRVRAVDNAGNYGNWADNFKLTVSPGQPTLLSPANGAKTNDNTPTFQWTSGSNANSHRLLVDNDPGFTSPIENRLFGATDNTYTPTLENSYPDENYSWKVIAIRGTAENSSSIWTFLVDITPPGKPTLTSPENNKLDNNLSQTFKWTQPPENSLPLTYHIQIDNEASFTSPYLRENMGVGENSYIYSFTSAGTYYWRVRAKDNAGNWGAWSDNFKLAIVIPVGALPTKPVLVSPTNGAKTNDNTPTFQWTKGENAENHRLLVDNDLDFSSPVDNILLGAADNTWTKSAPGYVDGTYYWSVVAINAAGENRSLKWAFRVETVPLVAPTSAKWLLIAGILAAVMIGLAVVIYTRRRRVGGKRRGILRGS